MNEHGVHRISWEEKMSGAGRSTVASITALALAVGLVAVSSAASAGSAALPHGGRVVATIPIPAGYGGLVVGEGAVWAMNDATSTLTRIDPQTNAVAASITVNAVKECPRFVCGELAVGDGAVWIPRASDNAVSRIDVANNKVVATIPVGPRPTATAVTPGAVWVANAGGPTVSRIDPATNDVVATIRIGQARAASDRANMTVAAGAIWVTVPNLRSVVRIDPATNKVTGRLKLALQPCAFVLAVGTRLWASSGGCGGDVGRGDLRRIKPLPTVTGFRQPIGLAFAFGSVWVADVDRKTIDRVNPRTGRIVARLRVGGYPVRLGVGFDSLWVRDDTGRVLRIQPQR
jgi:YVTN family beta-propeller protein